MANIGTEKDKFTWDIAPPEQSPPHTLQGQTIGLFVLHEEVGHGGFGAVYRAHHQQIPGEFAIKLIHQHQAHLSEHLIRFQREAQTLAHLQHPSIVQLIDFGHIEQLGYYMAMEFLRGQSFKEIIDTAYPLPQARLISLVSQLCEVLHFAHSKGVLHRDLKPSNIIVCQEPQGERIKLIDFGIAAAADHTHMTQTGAFLGSPPYMSPEQIKGEDGALGPPSDIYSLGILLAQLLTQKKPFEANNLTGYVTHHLFSNPPPLADLRPEIPWHPLLEACIACSLAKTASARYPDMLALRDAFIEGLRAQGEIHLQPIHHSQHLPSGSNSYPPIENPIHQTIPPAAPCPPPLTTTSLLHARHLTEPTRSIQTPMDTERQVPPTPQQTISPHIPHFHSPHSTHSPGHPPVEATTSLPPPMPPPTTPTSTANTTDTPGTETAALSNNRSLAPGTPDAPDLERPPSQEGAGHKQTNTLQIFAGALFLVLLMGVGAWALLWRKTPATKLAPTPTPTGQISLESTPTQALVFKGPRQICLTPCALSGNAGEKVVVTLRKPGYSNQVLKWTYLPTRQQKHITLTPSPRPPRPIALPPRQRRKQLNPKRRAATLSQRPNTRRQKPRHQHKVRSRPKLPTNRATPTQKDPFGIDPIEGLLKKTPAR